MAKRACLDCGRPTGRTRCRGCEALDHGRNPHGSTRYREIRDELVAEALVTGVGCAVCGDLEKLTLDLRVPWRQWKGKDPLSRRNLRVLCASCNTGKGDRLA